MSTPNALADALAPLVAEMTACGHCDGSCGSCREDAERLATAALAHVGHALAGVLAAHRTWRLDDSSPLVTRWLCQCGEAFPIVTGRAETSHDLHVATEILTTTGGSA